MIRGPMSKNDANENRPRCVRTGRMGFILAAARKDSEKRGQSIRCARGKLRRQHAADPKRPIRRTARCFRSKDRSGGGKTPEFLSSASLPGNLRARSVCRNRFSPVSRLAEAEPMFGFAPACRDGSDCRIAVQSSFPAGTDGPGTKLKRRAGTVARRGGIAFRTCDFAACVFDRKARCPVVSARSDKPEEDARQSLRKRTCRLGGSPERGRQESKERLSGTCRTASLSIRIAANLLSNTRIHRAANARAPPDGCRGGITNAERGARLPNGRPQVRRAPPCLR